MSNFREDSKTWIWAVWVWGYLISMVAGCGLFLATTSLVRSLCWLVIVVYGLAGLVWGREKQCATWQMDGGQ